MHKHCIISCLVLLLSLLLFAGCSTDDVPGGTTAEETSAAPEAAGITLAADGKCLFSVLRPEDATGEEIDTTVYLRQTAESFFGVMPDADTDWRIPKGIHSPAGFEILIGRTEAEESKAVYAELPYDGYTLRVVGSKLVAAGWDDRAYPILREMFTQLLVSCTKDGVCTIPADYCVTESFGSHLL